MVVLGKDGQERDAGSQVSSATTSGWILVAKERVADEETDALTG